MLKQPVFEFFQVWMCTTQQKQASAERGSRLRTLLFIHPDDLTRVVTGWEYKHTLAVSAHQAQPIASSLISFKPLFPFPLTRPVVTLQQCVPVTMATHTTILDLLSSLPSSSPPPRRETFCTFWSWSDMKSGRAVLMLSERMLPFPTPLRTWLAAVNLRNCK